MRAFSLLEVMIASATLSIGLAAVVATYGSAAAFELHQERVTAAMHLGEARVEELLVLFPDADDLKIQEHTPSTFTVDGTPTSTAAAYFTVGWTVAAGPVPRTRLIEVTVTWNEDRGPQQLTLSTHRS